MIKIRTIFKGLVLVAVVAAAGWLIWKSLPPYASGNHSAAEIRAGADSSMTEAASVPASPKIGNCPVFPADNVWNTPVEKLRKDSKSEAYIGSIGPLAKLHPDFGSSLLSGMPFTEVPANTRRVGMQFDYRDDSDLGNYPVPPDAPIEGGSTSTGDRHILLIDQRRCILYEIFDAHLNPDGTWKAGAGARFDLTSNALRDEGKTSADAAGLPIFPGLLRYDEVAAGEINHALRFTIPHTQAAFIWPARHKASRITDTNVAPMGIRVRLRADYDISRYSKSNQVILTAMKKYGMLLADNGGPMFISGVPDKRWNDEDLHRLTDITAADFEVVDESDWLLLGNSGRVDPVSVGK